MGYTFFVISLILLLIVSRIENDNIKLVCFIFCVASIMLTAVFSDKQGRVNGIKDYLNNECVVDTLTMTPKGELVEIEVKYINKD